MADRPRALFLSPEPPYPVRGGGPLRSASLLEFLSARYETDVFTCRDSETNDPLACVPSNRFARVFACPLPVHSRQPAARIWRNLDRLRRGVPPLLDRFRAIGPALAEWIGSTQYDLAIIEHFWCAPHASILRPRTKRLVLDLHNLESSWHARCGAAESGPQRWAHARFAERYRALEAHWLPQFDDILTTSGADAELVLVACPSARTHPYPNALPWHAIPSVTREPVVAFSGNFEYLPNVQAVRFFRDRIWPKLTAENASLIWRLIGRNPGGVARWTGGDSRIESTGPVADAIEELGRAQVAVVPLLSGSGTRLKILEAWAAGTPVVTTSLGAEGLEGRNGEHWLVADDPDGFANAVGKLLSDNELAARIGRAGRQLFQERYTWDAAWRTLKWLTKGE